MKTASLDELLAACRDDYRNTLLDRLDEMWLNGRDALPTPELNALNAAAHELQVLWGLHYSWKREAHPRAALSSKDQDHE